MQCSKHTDHQADGMCAYSGRPFCAAELVDVDGRLYAKDNVGKVIAKAKQSNAAANVFMNSSSAAASSSVALSGSGKKQVNHVFHLIMTIFTAGLWLPVWLIRAC